MVKNIFAGFGALMLVVVLVLVSPALGATAGYASYPAPVPGATNPAVTQLTIGKTICKRGWTATVRPSAGYTSKLKRRQMAQWHIPGAAADYEEDHLVSLELGGHPTSPNNLYPQPWTGEFGAHRKDQLENTLRRLVCSGALTLATAQHEIATSWPASYQTRVVK